MRRGIAAVAVLAILASGCGKAATLTAPSAKTPLSVPASSRLCPPSDTTPRGLLLSKTATDVLVPGHPTSALICRYWGSSGRIPEPEDERARIPEGEHGHAVYTIAEARRVVRQDVTSYLASELDALRPIGPHPNCDEELGGRCRADRLLLSRRRRSASHFLPRRLRCGAQRPDRPIRTWHGARERRKSLDRRSIALTLPTPGHARAIRAERTSEHRLRLGRLLCHRKQSCLLNGLRRTRPGSARRRAHAGFTDEPADACEHERNRPRSWLFCGARA